MWLKLGKKCFPLEKFCSRKDTKNPHIVAQDADCVSEQPGVAHLVLRCFSFKSIKNSSL